MKMQKRGVIINNNNKEKGNLIRKIQNGRPITRMTTAGNQNTTPIQCYSQELMDLDLAGEKTIPEKAVKTIESDKPGSLLKEGDLVFNAVTSKAALASELTDGMYYSSNFYVLTPQDSIDPKFLVYLLNENRTLQKQMNLNKTGTLFTRPDFLGLHLEGLPSLEKQTVIGEIYFLQNRLNHIRERKKELADLIVKERLRREVDI